MIVWFWVIKVEVPVNKNSGTLVPKRKGTLAGRKERSKLKTNLKSVWKACLADYGLLRFGLQPVYFAKYQPKLSVLRRNLLRLLFISIVLAFLLLIRCSVCRHYHDSYWNQSVFKKQVFGHVKHIKDANLALNTPRECRLFTKNPRCWCTKTKKTQAYFNREKCNCPNQGVEVRL